MKNFGSSSPERFSRKITMDTSSILEQLNEFGAYQKCMYVIICYVQILLGFHLLADVFLMGEPKHRCYVETCDQQNSNFYEDFVQFSIPNVTNEGTGTQSSCGHFSQITLNYSCESDIFNQSSIVNCKSYIWDKTVFESTTISDFDLVCDKSWYSTLSSSIFMLGFLVGSAVCGVVADQFGRKTAILISMIVLIISSTVTAFSTTFVMFSLFRFLTGASLIGLYQASYILGLEYVGISKRVIYSNITQIMYPAGTFVFGVLAYFIRDWRTLELAISIPGVSLLLCYWVLPESLRWLVSNGKHEGAKKTIAAIAKWNKLQIPENLLLVMENNSVPSKKIRALELLKTPRLRNWSLIIFFNWIVNSLVYYGVALDTGHLYDDIHINFCLLSFVEILAIILCTFVQVPFGSRRILCSTLILCGLACGVTVFIPSGLTWVSVMMAVIGRATISISFCAVPLYSSEIFPTVLRNTGVGFCSTISRFGAILAPVIIHLGKVHSSLPMILFSIVSITAGLLTLFLPETHKRRLPDTIEDVENFGISE